ncbi:MAG TPA: AgmX/PglI C-terminal domain-containing protein [Polyangia bacterium]|jgi:hypothetical protein
MKHVWVGLAVLAAVGGCSKGGTANTDEQFDKRWVEVSKSIPDTFYIEDDRAAGLMGNVTRSPHVPDGAQPSPGGGPLPVQLEMGDISKTIRGNLSAVKVCYLREQRTGSRSGKAIVTFDINTDGKVGQVAVNAPSFKGTNLPTCVGDQVKKLAFPKFQKGPQTVSYPFVFVGS